MRNSFRRAGKLAAVSEPLYSDVLGSFPARGELFIRGPRIATVSDMKATCLEYGTNASSHQLYIKSV